MGRYQFGRKMEDNNPKGMNLIGTIDFSTLTVASTTYINRYLGVLSRKAKRRTFVVTSTLNQQIQFTIAPYDNSIGDGYLANSNAMANMSTNTSSAYTGVISSLDNSSLGAGVDSTRLVIITGATLPTSGQVKIYCNEVI